MACLILASFIEVAIYSYTINPGKDIRVYDEHAMESAPYISGILGFISFYFISRFWTRKKYYNIASMIWLFPIIYLIIDLLIFLLAQVDFSEFVGIFTLTNGLKFLGSYSGYILNESFQKNTNE